MFVVIHLWLFGLDTDLHSYYGIHMDVHQSHDVHIWIPIRMFESGKSRLKRERGVSVSILRWTAAAQLCSCRVNASRYFPPHS